MHRNNSTKSGRENKGRIAEQRNNVLRQRNEKLGVAAPRMLRARIMPNYVASFAARSIRRMQMRR